MMKARNCCLLLATCVVFGCESQAEVERKVVSETVAARETAAQLTADYEANEVAADKRLKGKVVEVIGTIADIGKDVLDDAYVLLAGGESTWSGVQCFASEAQQSAIATFRKGQTVTAKGRCDGKLLHVIVRGCVFRPGRAAEVTVRERLEQASVPGGPSFTSPAAGERGRKKGAADRPLTDDLVVANGPATALFAEYERNEVAADRRYKGHVGEVRGTVQTIGKDIMGEIYVSFAPPTPSFGSVQCFLRPSQQSVAAKLSAGDRVRIRGYCDGKCLNVILRDCILQNPS